MCGWVPVGISSTTSCATSTCSTSRRPSSRTAGRASNGPTRPTSRPRLPSSRAGTRRFARIIAAADETFIWALFDRPALERWSVGRATLLGDACHPMLPFMGQGAAQAIEDGAALTACLVGTSRADVPTALHRYERLRLPRVHACRPMSLAISCASTSPTDPNNRNATHRWPPDQPTSRNRRSPGSTNTTQRASSRRTSSSRRRGRLRTRLTSRSGRISERWRSRACALCRLVEPARVEAPIREVLLQDRQRIPPIANAERGRGQQLGRATRPSRVSPPETEAGPRPATHQSIGTRGEERVRNKTNVALG